LCAPIVVEYMPVMNSERLTEQTGSTYVRV